MKSPQMSLAEAELLTDKMLRKLEILDTDVTNKEFPRVIALADSVGKQVTNKQRFADMQLKAIAMGAKIPVPTMGIDAGGLKKIQGN